MGQTQSTSARNSSDLGEKQVERSADYYELIGVERDASGEEIKKAYRKKALELHPDRNYGNVEEATKLFAEIQSAYEVLSDPHERAWYDSHREAFLRTDGIPAGDHYSYNTRITTSDDILKLFSKFTPGMEFSDSPTGFYGGLREIFAQLALEEKLACQWENLGFFDYPTFGTSDDDFEHVVRPFYAAWSGFSTKKSFAWREAYRYSEAPDRRVRRMMEKENKRLREEGIREFNDAVRSLVAFVKKRDPRYKMNTQSEAQRQETLRKSAAAQAARSRAINQAKLREHVTPDWVKSEEPEEDPQIGSECELEHFECVVCRKKFKSQKQIEVHERSKKHIKAIKQLCWEMKVQDKQLNLEASEDRSNEEELTGSAELPERNSYNSRAATSQLDGEAGISELGAQSPSSRHMPLVNSEVQIAADKAANTDMNSVSSNDASPHMDTGNCTSVLQDDADYAPREAVECRLRPELFSSQEEIAGEVHNSFQRLSMSELDKAPPADPRKLGKAKQKRVRKAA